ncbi:MAG: phosphodiester glycosidase family protein [Lachnospirales bacterium]
MLRKKIFSFALVTSLSFSTIVTIYADTVYIDSIVTTQNVASGIDHSTIEILTSSGFVDVNMLTVDLTNPNVDFDILRDDENFGYQRTLTELIGETSATNVVGAVNGSFFHMDTTPTDVIGYEYENDEFVFVKENYNKEKLEENSIIISDDNQVTFDYMQANTIIYNSKWESLRPAAINSTRQVNHLTVITDVYMSDTSEIDKNDGIYKIVVEDGYVKEIVEPYVTAYVPENGFILTVYHGSGGTYLPMFPVGERVIFDFNTTFDDILDTTKILMSGASTLLRDGVIAYDGLTSSPNARHPRTAVGVSQDGTTMYIAAIDGRGSSIGMTHKETAEFLQSVGAYNAVNLDGGGSTTYAVREEGETQAEVVNNPSGGYERKVINGLGVTSSPTGEIAELIITPSSTNALTGQPVSFTVRGVDENLNPVSVDTSVVTFSDATTPDNLSSDSLTFNESGVKTINANYYGLTSQTTINVYSEDQVNLSIKPISVPINGSQNIEIVATTSDGTTIPVDESILSFNTSGNFTASNGVLQGGLTTSNGEISTNVGNKIVRGKVNVGSEDVFYPITSFEGLSVSTRVYPEGTSGATGIYNEGVLSGSSAIKTSFNFKANGQNQAVYSMLSGIKINDSRAEKLSVNYYGDGSGNSVKAMVKDKNDNVTTLVFTNSVDFNGYKRLEADLPDNMLYPVEVTRLYVASTGNKTVSGKGYFDDLSYSIGDYFTANLDNINLESDPLYNSEGYQNVYAISPKANNTLTSEYKTDYLQDTKVISVSADNGSIAKTNAYFYGKLRDELYSSSQKNIIIVTSQSVYDNTYYITQEGVMMKNMLEKYVDTYDKNVYYVNNHANNNTTYFKNGVRYINTCTKTVNFSLDNEGNLNYSSN